MAHRAVAVGSAVVGFGAGTLAGKDAGIEYVGDKRIHPHHFRHSYSIYMVDRISIRKLQELLGHSDINTTAHYLQYSEKDIGDDVEKAWED